MNEPASHGPIRDADEAAVDSEWRKIEAARIAEEQEEAREDLLDAERPRRRNWPWLGFAAALAAGLLAAVLLNTPAAVSRRTVAMRSDAAAPAPVKPATVRDESPEPVVEEFEAVVIGREGRRLLARLIGDAGIDRVAGFDDEPVRGAGVGEPGATLEGSRLEIVAVPEAVAAFLEALDRQPAGSLVRLAPRRAATRSAPAAMDEVSRGVAADTPDADAPLRRLVIRLVSDDLPESSSGPAQEVLDE